MTSSPRDPYEVGNSCVTIKETIFLILKRFLFKLFINSDRDLQLGLLKLELPVIVNQHVTVNNISLFEGLIARHGLGIFCAGILLCF